MLAINKGEIHMTYMDRYIVLIDNAEFCERVGERQEQLLGTVSDNLDAALEIAINEIAPEYED